MASRTLLAATLLGLAVAQTPGSGTENHPSLKTWKCTKAGGCTEKNSYVVIDSASHWIHQKNNTALGCGNWGSAADPTACPDKETCAQNCIMEPISDYKNNAIYTNGGELKLDMFNQAGSTSSPRLYLLGEDKKNYEMLQLTGGELAFDVDVSRLPCGMNGALYLSEMRADGGRSALNPGGATYGTGYCKSRTGYKVVDGALRSRPISSVDCVEANSTTYSPVVFIQDIMLTELRRRPVLCHPLG